jgi:hypothetical protein
MTRYPLRSLFPALPFGVAVLGFFGQEGLIDRTADYLADYEAPPLPERVPNAS